MSTDFYTVTQAAALLGVSPKRVRQLVNEGKIDPVAKSKPMKLHAISVLDERRRRATNTATTPALNAGSMVEILLQIDQARAAGLAQGLELSQRQITATEATAALTLDELHKVQAERKELNEQLRIASMRVAELEAIQATKRGFFRR